MEIRYLTYQQLDKSKWDACITNASNGLIYGYSVYLDAMAKHWDALVLNDYEAVMPLTWNKKYGILYLYQPPFTACLGVFGNALTPELVNSFLAAVPKKFRYWDIYCNPGNVFTLQDFDLYTRMNFVLKLDRDYNTLLYAYRDNLKRNIKKSEQFGLTVQKHAPLTEAIDLAQKQNPGNDPGDYLRFKKLFVQLQHVNQAIVYAARAKDGEVMASAVFFFSHNRAYYILVGNHPNGKTLGASHALINAFIRDHAGRQLLLDFEGSDVPSLAFFYSSFGATEERYSGIKLNRLPPILKWLKR